jgi:uncharacterized protein
MLAGLAVPATHRWPVDHRSTPAAPARRLAAFVGAIATKPSGRRQSPDRSFFHWNEINFEVIFTRVENAPAEIERRIARVVEDDLRSKMVLVAGPRQCGKTTLARALLARKPGAYLSADVAADRKRLREQALPESAPLWVLDEIHKIRGWQRWLKGLYDVHHTRHSILVTGSARLDLYSRGGDSMQGRYFLHRLHPFTLSEIERKAVPEPPAIPELEAAPASAEGLRDLLAFGGFPEPSLSGSARSAARWRLAYGTRLVRQDLRDLEAVRDFDRIEMLLDRLPAVVGSVLSINALREDLEVAFGTASKWLSALERLYAVFRVPPFGAPRLKAVKKEQKLYFWDWARVPEPGPRFENLVLLHLLRLAHWLEDVHGEKAELRYFRSPVGHEVDAVMIRRGKPWLAVEVKLDDRPLDGGLRYLLERVHVPWAFQVSLRGTTDRRVPGVGKGMVRIVPATRFLASMP